MTKKMSIDGRLFQARMWREYAMDWDRPLWHIKRRWVEHILKISRAECIRRARINLYLAKRLNHVSSPIICEIHSHEFWHVLVHHLYYRLETHMTELTQQDYICWKNSEPEKKFTYHSRTARHAASYFAESHCKKGEESMDVVVEDGNILRYFHVDLEYEVKGYADEVTREDFED